MAEKMTLTAALERYKKLTDGHGCTDGGCVVQRPTGMHTNGGCRCSRDPHTAQRVMYAAQIMADAIAAHIAQHAEMARDAARYHELLFLVGNKYIGETRHETAARYLRQAEQQGIVSAQAMTGESHD